ncbi:hypothetical protein [Ramlibacter sp.]|uniref:hypothetical protein n=1 Tax=Ramlibacter sp. TaxID=1917967 RepID=UPI002C0C8E44|nr:hypothetical protein [Ramlibacter sp.]HWI84624.1 hypothetical protein [Ramlibacter sp.]
MNQSGPIRTVFALVLRLAVTATLALGWVAAHAYAGPGALRAKYDQLSEQLRHNNFGRALYVDSSEAGDTLKGDVYAVVNYPFATVSKALKEPDDWCDVLLLPFNTKYCRAAQGNGGAVLQVRIGRKYDQPVQDAYRLEFSLQPVAATADYFESRLSAASGPIGTRDYRIVVSAVPIDAKRTFMHFSYSYAYGMAGRLAMQGYLATAGADKVGFSISGRDGAGQPIYIGGVRGAIERTAMRYYLAIDAHLASLAAPPDQQLDRRIETWFRESERYPRQLHEMDRATYLAMKRGEYERQQAKVELR